MLLALAPATARAQTDEIQVYDAAIADPGQLTLTLHANYTPAGRTSPDFAGGVVTNRTLNGVTEWAYGMTDWWELGAYAPFVLTLDGSGRAAIDGAKLRSLFVSPHAADRPLFFGLNFELSYNRPQWALHTWELEVRPILGAHWRGWQLVLNPIFDLPLAHAPPDFAPCVRLAYAPSKQWAAGVELYQDFGPTDHLASLEHQQQEVFLVVDRSTEHLDLEVGIGWGLTRLGSDPLVLKMILVPTG